MAACATCGFRHARPLPKFTLRNDCRRAAAAISSGASVCVLCSTPVHSGFCAAHFAECFDAHLPAEPSESPEDTAVDGNVAAVVAHANGPSLGDRFCEVPTDALIVILRFVGIEGLVSLSAVSRGWLVASRALWRTEYVDMQYVAAAARNAALPRGLAPHVVVSPAPGGSARECARAALRAQRLPDQQTVRLQLKVGISETLRIELTTHVGSNLTRREVSAMPREALEKLLLHHQGGEWRTLNHMVGCEMREEGHIGVLREVLVGDISSMIQCFTGRPPDGIAFMDQDGYMFCDSDMPLLCCSRSIAADNVLELVVCDPRRATSFKTYRALRNRDGIRALWRSWYVSEESRRLHCTTCSARMN